MGKYIEEIVRKYLEGSKAFYPHLEFSSSFSMYSGEEPRTTDLQLSLRSTNLKSTEYDCTGTNNVIHYTSTVQSLFNIINSGFLRLSNLHVLNDPQELTFMIRAMGMEFPKKNINDFRDYFYSASFCRIENENQPDEFPMWRLYGGDGYGAAIVFEIQNTEDNWGSFLFGNVQYGENEAVERFKRFVDFHNKFQTENNSPIRNYPKALIAIMALHKNHIWGYENEIRLLSHQEYRKDDLKRKDHNFCKLRHSFTNNGTKYSYLELPLYQSEEYLYLKQKLKEIAPDRQLEEFIPILKIKKVILGYRHANNVFKIGETIYNVLKNSNIDAKVVQTQLREYMM